MVGRCSRPKEGGARLGACLSPAGEKGSTAQQGGQKEGAGATTARLSRGFDAAFLWMEQLLSRSCMHAAHQPASGDARTCQHLQELSARVN